MFQAIKPNLRRQAVSGVRTLPSPIGGLNARDAQADMPNTDALILDNIFPDSTFCALRRGYETHATSMVSAVQTLMTYHALNGSEKLFAAANGKIYNATVSGGAPSAYSTSITVNKWQYINFSNTGGLYILAVNGTDQPLKYDGSSWSTNSITGSVTQTSLINIFQHKKRVWLIQKNSLNLWYLASVAITGAATKFPLEGVFNKGGQIVAGGTFSFDAGAGIDDYFVAVTDNGEAAIYTGTNPATDFALVGVFEVGEPLGNRCLMKVGGDMCIMTTQGAVPLSKLINTDRAKATLIAITSKIDGLFNGAARSYKANFGWQGFVYPKGAWALFNVPEIEGTRQKQFIQNLITGAWCRFTNMNANCWALLNDEIYFGGNDGKVYKADTGKQDNGSQINYEMKTAFDDCGVPGQGKFFSALRPFFLLSGAATILAGINVDFDNAAPMGSQTAPTGASGQWGSGKWGSALWGGSSILLRQWLTVGRQGTYVAAHIKGAANGVSVQINGFDILYQKSLGNVF